MFQCTSLQVNLLQYFSRTVSYFPHHQFCSIASSGITRISDKYGAILLSLGVKAAGAWGWQPHNLHVLNVMKSGSLNLLEPSGPHRACYGTPLPLPFMTLCHYILNRYMIRNFYGFCLGLSTFFFKIKSYLVYLKRPCGESMQFFYALNNQHRLIPRLGQVSTTVAARSEAWVCGRSLAQIMGSNLAEGNDACLSWASSVVR
jgi:hypothetical protein